LAEALTIANCTAVLPKAVVPACNILIAEGRIVALGPEVDPQGEVVDAGGLIALPGFVDAHVHGAAGHEFNEASEEGAAAILRAHARFGTTALLAAVHTDSPERMLAAIENLAALAEPEDGAALLGIYVEGPFLNPQYCGAQPTDFILPPDLDLFVKMHEVARGRMRVFALAPEIPGAREIIRAAVQRGVRVSMAHTNATYAQVKEAVAQGLSQVTHLFNGMRGLHHREPGAAGAGLLINELDVEMIADGIHVVPEVVSLAIRSKGPERVLLISDALGPTGLPPGRYQFAGQPVAVSEGRATLVDKGIPLSVCTAARAFANVGEWTGLPLPDLARMACLNPARIAGCAERKGALQVGCDADIALMDSHYEVRTVYLRGRRLA